MGKICLSFKFHSFLATICWQLLTKKSMTATNSGFCNTFHTTYRCGKFICKNPKEIIFCFIFPLVDLSAYRITKLGRNADLFSLCLQFLPAFLTSCKSKCSNKNYLLPWKHMNYVFMPFSVYMLFSIMLYHRSIKACNLPVGMNTTFYNSVFYQLLMDKFFFNFSFDSPLSDQCH